MLYKTNNKPAFTEAFCQSKVKEKVMKAKKMKTKKYEFYICIDEIVSNMSSAKIKTLVVYSDGDTNIKYSDDICRVAHKSCVANKNIRAAIADMENQGIYTVDVKKSEIEVIFPNLDKKTFPINSNKPSCLFVN